MFKLGDFRFRKKFWSPWEQYKTRIGEPITVISVRTLDDDIEDVPLFSIRFPDGETIEAWEEEVVHPSTITVDGKLPPIDDDL